ncbi:MAG TPA: hypothetical protein VI789_00375 [Dehalococcoidia bacterium]|nr:hypothetical protein [Dehalococcoidia bacterium]
MVAQRRVAGVRFRGAGRIFYYDAGELDLHLSDLVVVDSEQGPQVGRVVIAPDQVLAVGFTGPMQPIARRATSDDLGEGPESAHDQ